MSLRFANGLLAPAALAKVGFVVGLAFRPASQAAMVGSSCWALSSPPCGPPSISSTKLASSSLPFPARPSPSLPPGTPVLPFSTLAAACFSLGVTLGCAGLTSMASPSLSPCLALGGLARGVQKQGANGTLVVILPCWADGSRLDCENLQISRNLQAAEPPPCFGIALGPPPCATSPCASIPPPRAGTSAIADRPCVPVPPLRRACAPGPRHKRPATAPCHQGGPDLHACAPAPSSPGTSSLLPCVPREEPREFRPRALGFFRAPSRPERPVRAGPVRAPMIPWRVSHPVPLGGGHPPMPCPRNFLEGSSATARRQSALLRPIPVLSPGGWPWGGVGVRHACTLSSNSPGVGETRVVPGLPTTGFAPPPSGRAAGARPSCATAALVRHLVAGSGTLPPPSRSCPCPPTSAHNTPNRSLL